MLTAKLQISVNMLFNTKKSFDLLVAISAEVALVKTESSTMGKIMKGILPLCPEEKAFMKH